MMFPGVTIAVTLFGNQTWSVLALITAYNVGDTIGKKIPNLTGIFSKEIVIYLIIIIRFGFFVIYILIARQDIEFLTHPTIVLTNTLLFAIFNGHVTASLFFVGPNKTEDGRGKSVIAFALTFGLTFGISSGTILAEFV